MNPKSSTYPEIMTFSDTCTELGFSRSKGEHLVRHGDFPKPFKIGAERFYLVDDVRAWIIEKAEKANGA